MTKARLPLGSIANSAEHKLLRELIQSEGGDVEAWRRLMACIGAHVRLVAHNRVFEHVARHLDGPVFQPQRLLWTLGEWSSLVPKWREGLRIAAWHEDEIASKFGHYAWDASRVGPKTGSHPMYGEWVSRFPLAASLWNAPWGEAEGAESALRWRLLQAHAMASAIEHRSVADLEDYERPEGTEASPTARTSSSSTPSRFIRRLRWAMCSG